MIRLAPWLLALASCVVTTPTDDLPDYEPCVFDSDCLSFDCERVLATWPDGQATRDSFCSEECTVECPADAAGVPGTCIVAADPEEPGRCYRSCGTDADCAGGFRCGAMLGDPVCLPY